MQNQYKQQGFMINVQICDAYFGFFDGELVIATYKHQDANFMQLRH
jgi:hypothetical protein